MTKDWLYTMKAARLDSGWTAGRSAFRLTGSSLPPQGALEERL